MSNHDEQEEYDSIMDQAGQNEEKESGCLTAWNACCGIFKCVTDIMFCGY